MICYVLAMGKQHLGPHVVVGYGINFFWPGPFITSPDHLANTDCKNAKVISNEKSTITQKTSFASIINKRCQVIYMYLVVLKHFNLLFLLQYTVYTVYPLRLSPLPSPPPLKIR